MNIFLQLVFGITITWGLLLLGVGFLFFTVGAGVGGIGQSFLVSNKFLEADPVQGQGVPCLTWALAMSSNGGGLELQTEGCPSFWALLLDKGLEQIFPLPTCIPLLVWMLQQTYPLMFGWR